MSKVKTLIFDIETSPIIAATWSLYPDSISHDAIIQDWYVICACWKWVGDKKVYSSKTYTTDDSQVIKDIKFAIEAADEVVAHNGKKFDLKKLNARALLNDIPPITPPVVVDTLVQARKHFALTSNRLDAVCKALKIPAKTGTNMKLWMDVLDGKKKAVDDMTKYCKNDVVILENVYHVLKPYMDTGFNRALHSDGTTCPKCGSHDMYGNGTRVTQTAVYQRYVCRQCGGSSRGPERLNESTKVLR